jgi:O-antigen/teichoic acid export membrane protein
LLDGTRGTVLVVTPVLVVGAAHGADLIRLWVGESYVQASLPVLQVFLAVMFLAVLESTSSRVLLGIGQVRFDAGVSFASGVANLVLSLILVGPYGLVGVAWGTLIPTLLLNVFVSIPYTCRVTGTATLRFYAGVLLPAAAVVVGSLLFMALTHRLIGHPIGTLVADSLFGAGLGAVVLFRSVDVRRALALGANRPA